MVNIVKSNECQYVWIPKNIRCDSLYCNEYQFIIQHILEKNVVVYKVRNFAWNPLRYLFKLYFPKCLKNGEYSYYLTTYYNWINCQIDRNDPALTEKHVKKAYLKYGDSIVTFDNTLLMTGWSNVEICSDKGMLTKDDVILRTLKESYDKSGKGTTVARIKVLDHGLMNISDCKGHEGSYFEEQKEFISFKG